MTFMHVTRAHQETRAACSLTMKMRCFQMQKIRGIVSGGEASALIQKEVLILSDEERQSLLDKAGISSSIELGAAEVLVIKAGLAIPWNKLRLLRRYVTAYSKGTNSNSLVGGSNRQASVWRVRKGCVTFPAKLLVITSKERCPVFFWWRGNKRRSFGIHSTSGG